ncbi:MAG: hypothetical protein IJA32_16510 [Lachnospiraceae bacterium]|nr:hypothetical protein [Lachnospiraceae bacterium]
MGHKKYSGLAGKTINTIDDRDEVIVDICEVCFWQYDEVAQDNPK